MQDNRILAFPLGGQAWRLDWLGDVSYRRQLRYTQPFIRVALSKVSLDPDGKWAYPTTFESAASLAQAILALSEYARNKMLLVELNQRVNWGRRTDGTLVMFDLVHTRQEM